MAAIVGTMILTAISRGMSDMDDRSSQPDLARLEKLWPGMQNAIHGEKTQAKGIVMSMWPVAWDAETLVISTPNSQTAQRYTGKIAEVVSLAFNLDTISVRIIAGSAAVPASKPAIPVLATKPIIDPLVLSPETSARVTASETAHPIVYYAGILSRCTLPHTDPADNQARKEGLRQGRPGSDENQIYQARVNELREHGLDGVPMDRITRRDGNLEIEIVSGRCKYTKELLGLPVRSMPRVLMTYICSEVVKRGPGGSRCIHLGETWGECLSMLDMPWSGGQNGAQKRRDITRLLASEFRVTRRDISMSAKFTTSYRMWDEVYDSESDTLKGGWLILSQEFFDDIEAHAPPYSIQAIRMLSRSPIAQDAYLFVSNVLYRLNNPGSNNNVRVSYSSMQAQIGTGIATENYRKFRSAWRRALKAVQQLWADNGLNLRIDIDTYSEHFVIYRSPQLVPSKSPLSSEERSGLFKLQRFDDHILRRAQRIAPGVDILQKQTEFFASISRAKGTVKDPAALFLHRLQFSPVESVAV